MPSFLAIGECMIELADVGQSTYRRGFAGDTFNTAWYARQMLSSEWNIAYGSCIGTDRASEDMQSFMMAEGISTNWIRRIEGRSVGLYMITLDKGERSFSYWRTHSAARLLADDAEWLDQMVTEYDVIYFSGITMAILSPESRVRLCRALSKAKENGALIAFDTNLRPQLWESSDAMRKGMMDGASVADIVFPSFDEEVQLFADPSPLDTVARYSKAGAGCVVVKNGANELTLWDKDGLRSIPTAPVSKIVDTTAAGDSFAAAFLSAYMTGASLDEAAQHATKLAAQVVQSHGALVPNIFKGDR